MSGSIGDGKDSFRLTSEKVTSFSKTSTFSF